MKPTLKQPVEEEKESIKDILFPKDPTKGGSRKTEVISAPKS